MESILLIIFHVKINEFGFQFVLVKNLEKFSGI